jgi:hypothetical protein
VEPPHLQTPYSCDVANNNKKSKAPEKAAAAPVSRLQRSLMYIAGSILGLGVISIIALLIGEATVTAAAFQGSQVWAVVALLPAIAIPLGFVLLIALLVVTYVQRSRADKVAGK